MTKSAQEAEREVEASRSELNRTMDELKQRMSPGQLLDEAMRALGGSGGEIASRFAEQAKANPMPLAVIGLGLAWLMTSSNRSAGAYGPSEPRSFAPAEGGGHAGMGGKLADALGDAAGRASTAASSAADAVTGAAASAGHGASHAAAGAARQAGSMGRYATDTVSDLMAREPLLLGGIGLLLGLAAGAALPPTETEDRLLGETRDRMVEKGRAAAQAKVGEVKEAARATVGSVEHELEGGDGQSLAERAGNAVRAGLETAQEQAQTLTH
jgi:hypothetical protein